MQFFFVKKPCQIIFLPYRQHILSFNKKPVGTICCKGAKLGGATGACGFYATPQNHTYICFTFCALPRSICAPSIFSQVWRQCICASFAQASLPEIPSRAPEQSMRIWFPQIFLAETWDMLSTYMV